MKGLEALKWIDEFIGDIFPKDKNIDILFKYGMRKETVEKELKALEIINKKCVNVNLIKMSSNVNVFNNGYEDKYKLTQQEYDLLKEVLKNE